MEDQLKPTYAERWDVKSELPMMPIVLRSPRLSMELALAITWSSR
jgi:hypothetical protein